MRFDLGHINKIAVVTIMLDGEQASFNYLRLKKAKDEIHFVKQSEHFSHREDLIKAVGNKQPVLLHFLGKGILNRQVKWQENYRHTILLNSGIDGFYFTDYRQDDQVFSSVIRKDVVQEYINQFEEAKCQIIGFSSGPFLPAFLQPTLQKNNWLVHDIQLEFEGEKLMRFSKADEKSVAPSDRTLMLGDEQLSHRFIAGAAVGAAFFHPVENLVWPENEAVFVTQLEEAKQKNIFTRFGMGMMLFFLVILFANYLYLGQLNQTFAENEYYLQEFDEKLNQIAFLEDEKLRKEKLLKSSGLLNKNFLSYYLMELANSVPDEIGLDGVTLRPVVGEIKPRKKIAFEEHLILIDGHAETSRDLSRWIEAVEQEDWVSKVEILDYAYVKDVGYFELEMIVF